MVDCDLAIGLCTLLSKAEIFKILWKVIDNTWQNYDKILVGTKNMFSVLLSKLVFYCFQSTNFFSPTVMRSGDKSQDKKFSSLFGLQLVNLISDGVLIVSGCGQDRRQSLLLVRRGGGTKEVSVCHH